MNVELLLNMLTGPFASMSLKDTTLIVDYIARLIRPHDAIRR
jgi:hypothetical protein